MSDKKFHKLKKRRQIHKSSSFSSGKGVSCASLSSASYICCIVGSMTTSGGRRAGISVNSRLGSPVSFRVNHKNGFSKL